MPELLQPLRHHQAPPACSSLRGAVAAGDRTSSKRRHPFRSPTTSPWMAAARARVRPRNRATTASPQIRRVPAISAVPGPPRASRPLHRRREHAPPPSAPPARHLTEECCHAPGSARLRRLPA